MNRNPLARALRPFRGASQAQAQDTGRPSACEPMDENALTLEIARILKRPCSAPTRHCHTAQLHWLGEEADRAIVDAYVATPRFADEPDGEPNADENFYRGRAAAATDDDVPANFSDGTAAQWVRHARRDRFRTKVRDAAGWTVSTAVSLLLVAVVGLAMYGWPNGSTTLRQIEVKSLKVSTTSHQPRLSAAATAAAAKAQQELLATVEDETVR